MIDILFIAHSGIPNFFFFQKISSYDDLYDVKFITNSLLVFDTANVYMFLMLIPIRVTWVSILPSSPRIR